jgi:hypothetical protein
LALWQRAEAVAGDSLSALLTNALREYVISKEMERMTLMVGQHGEVTKRLLYVWGQRADDDRTEVGTSFESEGTGPDRAEALVRAMRMDPDIVRVQLEERRVYRDKWVDRRVVSQWQKSTCDNCGHPLVERIGRDVAEVPFGVMDYPLRCLNCKRQWTDDQSFWRSDPPVPGQPATAAGRLTNQP